MVAAADGVAVDAGNHRLQAVLNARVRVDRRGVYRAATLDLLQPPDVAAGTEGAVPGAGDCDDADFKIGGSVLHRLSHLGEGVARQGVDNLRAVDGDPRTGTTASAAPLEDLFRDGLVSSTALRALPRSGGIRVNHAGGARTASTLELVAQP